jgi:PAS domain S-box-containing protein
MARNIDALQGGGGFVRPSASGPRPCPGLGGAVVSGRPGRTRRPEYYLPLMPAEPGLYERFMAQRLTVAAPFGGIRLPASLGLPWRIVVVAAAYFAAAMFGFNFSLVGDNASTIWPASGIAVAAVFLAGTRVWIGVFAGSLLANALNGDSLPVAAILAVEASAQALLAAWLLRRGETRPQLDRPRDVVLLASAAVVGGLAGGVVGVGGLVVAGGIPVGSAPLAFGAWALGDTLSIALVGGFALTAVSRPDERATAIRRSEAAAELAALTLVATFLFFDLFDLRSSGQSVAFPLVPVAIWIAFRLGPRGHAIGSLLFTAIAILATDRNVGPFVGTWRPASFLYLGAFVAIVWLTGALVAAISTRESVSRRALVSSQQRLRAVLGAMPIALIATDLSGRVTLAEGSLWERLAGKPGAGFGSAGASLPDAVHAAIASALAGRPSREFFEDGAASYEVDSIPTRAGGRGVAGAIGIVRDLGDERRRALENARLAGAVEQTADAILVTDAQANIVYVNPAFERMTGYPRNEVLGLNPRFLNSGHQGREVYEQMWTMLGEGRTWTGELLNKRRDGILYHERMSISPVRGESGERAGYVAVQSDVTDLRSMAADLELQDRIRTAWSDALHGLPADASLEAASTALVDHLARVPGVDIAAVGGFVGRDRIRMVASGGAASEAFVTRVMEAAEFPRGRARRMRRTLRHGPMAGYWSSTPEDGAFGRSLDELGLRAFAFGPIIHGNHVDGGVVIGTADDAFARTLVEKSATVLDLSSVSSAVLADRLHAWRSGMELHERLASVLEARSFHPVFQPIADLATGEIVADEALTRFDGGERPDHVFGDAWTVGLGPDLEFVTLAAAIREARRLPQGRWLDLNVSPRLLADADRLKTILRTADRPIVLEVTEHEEVADYAALRNAIRDLGNDVRVAVDDAGVGVANFGHIIELGAEFVKLDASIIRRVNGNLGRQALVVGMRHFARTSGCRLVAEGIETEDELRTLRSLGVEFGQGYWIGRPAPIAD